MSHFCFDTTSQSKWVFFVPLSDPRKCQCFTKLPCEIKCILGFEAGIFHFVHLLLESTAICRHRIEHVEESIHCPALILFSFTSHGRHEVYCINPILHVVIVDLGLGFCLLVFWHSHLIVHRDLSSVRVQCFINCTTVWWNLQFNELLVTMLTRSPGKQQICQCSTTPFSAWNCQIEWLYMETRVSFSRMPMRIKDQQFCDKRQWLWPSCSSEVLLTCRTLQTAPWSQPH